MGFKNRKFLISKVKIQIVFFDNLKDWRRFAELIKRNKKRLSFTIVFFRYNKIELILCFSTISILNIWLQYCSCRFRSMRSYTSKFL